MNAPADDPEGREKPGESAMTRLRVIFTGLKEMERGHDRSAQIALCLEGLGLLENSDHLLAGILNAQLSKHLRFHKSGDIASNRERAIAAGEDAVRILIASSAQTEIVAGAHEDLADLYTSLTHRSQADVDDGLRHYLEAITLREGDDDRSRWAHDHWEVASLYLDRATGDRPTNIEEAISHCRCALSHFSEGTDVDAWARLTILLGIVYLRRPGERRMESVARAIELFQNVLASGLTEQTELWATAHHNIAMAYGLDERITDQQRIELIIKHNEEALRYPALPDCEKLAYPVHRWLAIAFKEREAGEGESNVARAAEHFEEASRLLRPDVNPGEWATLRFNAGLLYMGQTPSGKTDVERAIECFRQADDIFSQGDYPGQPTLVLSQLGKAFLMREEGDSVDNLEQAIAYFEAAYDRLDQYHQARDRATLDWRLCDAYAGRSKGNLVENQEKAITHGVNALEVFKADHDKNTSTSLNVRLAELFANRVVGPKDENLDRAVQHGMDAVEVLSCDDTPFEWARCHSILGFAYLCREHGVAPDNEEKAFYHFAEALKAVTQAEDPENWARLEMNRGLVYYKRSRRDRASNLDEAITCLARALAVADQDGSPELRARIHSNLGIAFSDRTEGNRPENEETALSHFRSALLSYSKDNAPREWAKLQYDVGRLYVHRYAGDKKGNIEDAIEALHNALEIRTRETSSMEWARTHDVLGSAYRQRIEGNLRENLERAFEHYSKALEVLTPSNAPYEWALVQSNLALAYRDRQHGDREENIEEAIRCGEASLTIFTSLEYPVEWARVCSNLSGAFQVRSHGELSANRETAIDYAKKALSGYERSRYPAEWASAQNTLGAAFLGRVGGDPSENVEQAIDHLQQALTVRSELDYPQDWAMTLSNLGGAYLERTEGDRQENIQSAIACLSQAREIFGAASGLDRRVGVLHNLGMALTSVARGDIVGSRRRAVEVLEEALTIASRDEVPNYWAEIQSALGIAYFELVDGGRSENIQRAIDCCARALEVRQESVYAVEWAKTHKMMGDFHAVRHDLALNDIAESIAHLTCALKVFSRDTLPAEYRATRGDLGHIHFGQGNYHEAQANFEEAISVGVLLLGSAYTEGGRRFQVSTASGLFAASAFCRLHMEEPSGALLRLEEGKTRLLNEALALSNLDLVALAETERTYLQAMRQRVHDLEAEMRLPIDTPARRSNRQVAEALRQTRGELSHRVSALRAERPDFMPSGLELSKLLGLIPAGGAIVAPLFTAKGSAAFVLPHGTTNPGKDSVVALDSFTHTDLRSLLQGPNRDLGRGGWLGAYTTRRTNWQPWLTAIETVGRLLWEQLIGPIHERLQSFGIQKGAPVVLLPQGGLGILPVHAAWYLAEDRKSYFLDHYTLSYSPSGFALDASQRRLSQERPRTSSLLAVINPTGDLPFTPAEGNAVLELFASSAREALVNSHATRDMVIQRARRQSYLHFACHGFYDWRDPMRSGLRLADARPLTLADIMSRLDLSATRLVTLSACETGLTEVGVSPDEYLGLPAGFLQRGAAGVVSSLWAVSDLSTMLLMSRFYRAHLQDGLSPASALRVAQSWLRDATNEQLAYIFEEYLDTTPARAGAPVELVRQAVTRYARSDRNGRPFHHPYHWAAFMVSGA